ncbi:unnamed protein product [Clonostachys chloroleuca]|uniref:CUE domain-containing protein n=1 Tax=Clonostachys chloroleuca TaxID=1926264 RepID=A0AA35MB40_9HYPO|nr:unnamed protein product [Clonostachys chloroleuca]
MSKFPPFAPFPRASWRQHLATQDWNSLLEAWLTLCQASLSLSDDQLRANIKADDSVILFLDSFMEETAEDGLDSLGTHSTQLLRVIFQLTSRLLAVLTSTTDARLFEFPFLSNFARVYPKKLAAPVFTSLFSKHGTVAEASLTSLKKLLIPHLESGIKGDLKLVHSKLTRLNYLLHASPDACALLLAGSDFFDGLVTCFRVMNPPLRKTIITTVYVCLIGLTENEPPKWSMLGDQLYVLKSAADSHKQGPLNVNDSLVPELVTSTPVLKVLSRRAESSGSATQLLKNRITALMEFKKGPMIRPKGRGRRRLDKGKGKQTHEDAQAEIHVHKMSQITQIQDLFPDLGAGFIAKCLDEYNEDVELVVANLLSESLPPHLATADRSEPLSSQTPRSKHSGIPAQQAVPSQLPTRKNVFDDDDFDRLVADTSKISFGKKPGKTADEILADRSSAPGKAAILSALAALDPDDDERDDTYDADDVGGTVDSANQEADTGDDKNEEILFRAWQLDAKVFDRDGATRRSSPRTKLREETGMADEALEGWALMLTRNPQQRRRLELKYEFSGQQVQLDRTSWRASPAGSGTEDNDSDRGASRGGRGGRGRGRGSGDPGRGRGGGNVAGPPGEKETEAARRRKEANKGSRANHNRRDARAKKMSRGGFAG